MINLTQAFRQFYLENQQVKERERREQAQRLISAQSTREDIYGSTTRILQANQNELIEQAENHGLISSPQSSTELLSDPSVSIIQTNQSNNASMSNVALRNVAQSNEIQTNAESDPSTDDDGKINLNAALLSFVLYLCCISLIVFGCIHLNDCPVEKMVPISYIVIGCLMLCSRILSSPEECRNIFKKENNPQFQPQALCRMCLNFIIQIATMCVFIALCYWIFHMNPDTKEGSPNFCEKDLYKNTYYGCIVALVILGIGIILICCGICFFCVSLYVSGDDDV